MSKELLKRIYDFLYPSLNCNCEECKEKQKLFAEVSTALENYQEEIKNVPDVRNETVDNFQSKPTYEELEAQAATYRQALDVADRAIEEAQNRLNDENFAYEEGIAIEKALSSTAGLDLLERMKQLEKAFELACDSQIDCPNTDHPAPWDCNKKKCDEVQCWKEYFLHKAVDSK